MNDDEMKIVDFTDNEALQVARNERCKPSDGMIDMAMALGWEGFGL